MYLIKENQHLPQPMIINSQHDASSLPVSRLPPKETSTVLTYGFPITNSLGRKRMNFNNLELNYKNNTI